MWESYQELVQNVMRQYIGTENAHLGFLDPSYESMCKGAEVEGAQSFIGDESGETAVWISWDRINEQPERSPETKQRGPEPSHPVRVASLYFIRSRQNCGQGTYVSPGICSSLLHLATELQNSARHTVAQKKDLISQTPTWLNSDQRGIRRSGKSSFWEVSVFKEGVVFPLLSGGIAVMMAGGYSHQGP